MRATSCPPAARSDAASLDPREYHDRLRSSEAALLDAADDDGLGRVRGQRPRRPDLGEVPGAYRFVPRHRPTSPPAVTLTHRSPSQSVQIPTTLLGV
jgi:hypothetical protein